MKIIIVNRKHGCSHHFDLSAVKCALLSVLLIGVPAIIGGVWGVKTNLPAYGLIDTALLSKDLTDQKAQVERLKLQSEDYSRAIAQRIAELQARLIRMDALGERLTSIAKLDKGEFDFSRRPALGGPESTNTDEIQLVSDFMTAINDMAQQIEDREQQLEILDALMVSSQFKKEAYLAGRPIKKGWKSSNYGYRTDPFNGKRAWHKGVDFAGKQGSDVVAVAAGVVTWSGKLRGYGDMVEVSHGNGFTTRYAHNSDNKVGVGDVVKKGQTLALMGSSGRSTGPHVHFEVYKHGRAVDPATYIRRTNR